MWGPADGARGASGRCGFWADANRRPANWAGEGADWRIVCDPSRVKKPGLFKAWHANTFIGTIRC